MSFKYINPGLPKLWGLSCGWKNSNTYNPINGFAFSESSSFSPLMTLPSDINEVWIKVGIYPYNAKLYKDYPVYVCIGSGSNKQGIALDNQQFMIMANNTRWVNKSVNMFPEVYYNALIHAVQGDNGYVECFINGKRIGIYNGNVSFGDNTVYAVTYSSYNTIYISNIIISDTEVKPTEEVYLLTAKTTTTDMVQTSESNNPQVFTADTAGQTIIQTIDTDALATKIGTNNIKVTGIGLGSHPIYYAGESLSHVGIMVNDIEEEVQEITTGTNDGLCWSRVADYNFNDLKTLKLGFKAKE